jgi:hypothetical protein
MELEDPRLHETEKMWVSTQHQINVGGMGILVILGLVVASMAISFADIPISDFAIPLTVLGVIGAVVTVYLIYTNTDKKDHWTLYMPYNRKLLALIDSQITEKFDEKGRTYALTERSGFSAIMALGSEVEYSKVYAMRTYDGSTIEIRFGLQVKRNKNGATYLFPMEIRNVRLRNLEFARAVQADLMEMLIGVDFLKYEVEP